MISVLTVPKDRNALSNLYLEVWLVLDSFFTASPSSLQRATPLPEPLAPRSTFTRLPLVHAAVRATSGALTSAGTFFSSRAPPHRFGSTLRP
jgi:hypothetical protein